MPDGPTIRRATQADDLEAIALLFREYAASLPIDLSYQCFADEVEQLPGKYAPPEGALLLASDTLGRSVGCVAMRPIPMAGACEMKRLYVAPEARGTGTGKALGAAIILEARQCGYRYVYLDTLRSMDSARALYRVLGFQPTSSYYETPVAGTLFYRLDLGNERHVAFTLKAGVS